MISVAIDGPAGAGKSTVARAAAKRLGFIYADTGALYRAIGLKFKECGVGAEDDGRIEKLLSETAVDIKFINGEQRVFLDGVDASDKIRTPEISMVASAVSANPLVRAFLLEMQRKLAEENNVLMDGRDIGTVVLPNATVKIYLTASVKVRAERRFKELAEKGESVTLDEVCRDIEKRDFNDMNRAVSPLKMADDALLADTSELTLEDSVELIVRLVRERVG